MNEIPLEIPPPGVDLTEANQDPPAWFKYRVLETVGNTPWRRYPNRTQPGLIKSISDSYGVEEENVLLVRGCTEGLHLAFRFVQSQGLALNIPDPSYFGFSMIAKDLGMELSYYPSGDEPACHGFPEAWTVVCSPENPTGFVYTRESIFDSSEVSSGVVLDLTYDLFSDYPHTESMRELTKTNTISILSLSKAYGLAGIRLGLIFAKSEIIHQLSKMSQTFSMDYLQLASLMTLFSDDGDFWRREAVEDAVALRRRVEGLIHRILPGLEIPRSQTNFVSIPTKGIPRKILEGIVECTSSKLHSNIGLLRVTANQRTLDGLISLTTERNNDRW
ncbi:aminotransferase class I/II-fold pyridoxal phosphate-dependent enzyme [Nocardiopsis xinjiangensis]|uniref:aminotransferase class I/II-fold pyridoxal phosphate-dependent enzyme n=1 Tax=Nocardiopsis xinjiangensis TaxID=124285 RepID=UPI0013767A30|nr:aminotransferase class I/II-fold pyridoxal phosphate-dependent enzyme [Nocardiopsis xinjiangensis]